MKTEYFHLRKIDFPILYIYISFVYGIFKKGASKFIQSLRTSARVSRISGLKYTSSHIQSYIMKVVNIEIIMSYILNFSDYENFRALLVKFLEWKFPFFVRNEWSFTSFFRHCYIIDWNLNCTFIIAIQLFML